MIERIPPPQFSAEALPSELRQSLDDLSKMDIRGDALRSQRNMYIGKMDEIKNRYPHSAPEIAEYLITYNKKDLIDHYHFKYFFKNVDFNKVAHTLIAKGNIEALTEGLPVFPKKGHAWNTVSLLDGVVVHALAEYIKDNYFRPYMPCFAECDEESALIFIQYGSALDVARAMRDQFPNLHTERVARAVLDKLRIGVFLEFFEVATLPRTFGTHLMERWLTDPKDELDTMIGLNRQFTPPLSEAVDRFVAIAGTHPSAELLKQFVNGRIDETRLRELMDIVKEMTNGTTETTSLEKVLSDNNLLLALKSRLRVDSSSWGSSRDDETKEAIERYLQNKDGYAPLPEEYVAGTLPVAKLDKKKDRAPETYTPEFKDRWPILIEAVIEASRYAQGTRPLSELISEFADVHEKMVDERRENVERHQENPKAREHAERALAVVESVPQTPRGLGQAFTTLFDSNKTKDLNRILLVFGLALAMRTHNIRENFYAIDNVNPSAHDISRVLELVTHVAHQETWEKSGRFADKASREKLNQLFHVKALEDQLQKMQKGEKVSKDSATLEVRPSRDILTEFSGHMGDACWASKYEILARPNISSLSFFMEGKVAGSALLIDTEVINKKGDSEQMTIIRGLNPLEAVINRLDPESFVRELVAYLEPIAKKRGRKLAIVIDTHSGGSATNRPMLFNYLQGLRNALQRVKGMDLKETEFNEYDITIDTYEISSSVFTRA